MLDKVCEEIESSWKKSATTLVTAKKLPPKKKDIIKKKAVAIKCNHDDIFCYKDETNWKYCKEGMDLHGVKCAGCKIKFGKQPNPPSIT